MSIPTTRKSAWISSHGNVRIQETPLDSPAKGEMVIRVQCSLISPGTELSVLRNRPAGGYQTEETWRKFGYQNAGIVEDANGCKGFAKGDRVAVLGGGYAPHSNWGVAPQNLVWKLPDEVSFEEGAFTNLLGTGLWATRRSQVVFGSHIAVVGLGIVGQLTCQFSRLSGAHVIGIDRVEMRKNKALELGAEHATEFDADNPQGWKDGYTRSYGLDAGVVAFGGDASAVVTHLAAVMKKAPDTHQYGKIVIVGGATINVAFPTPFGNIDFCASSRTGPGYHDKDWERGDEYPEAIIPWNARRNLEECFHAIAAGKLNVKSLITHRVKIDEVPEACTELVEHPNQALAVIVQHR